MNAFVGRFYVVTTNNSIYSVSIADLAKCPKIQKMARNSDRYRGRVPVGGILRGFFYLGITNIGCLTYRTKRHQQEPNGKPERFEDIEKPIKGPFTAAPVGLFFSRDAADECFAKGPTEAFDVRWHFETSEVLNAIGLEHPLVTISQKGKWKVPESFCPVPSRV